MATNSSRVTGHGEACYAEASLVAGLTVSSHLSHAFFLHLSESRVGAVQAWAAPLRQQLLALGTQRRHRWLVGEALRRYDLARLGLDEPPAAGQSWLGLAYAQARADLDSLYRDRRRCPDLDVGASVVLFEDEQQPGGLHGLYFIEMPALRQALREQPDVEWRPYQDQTDERPDGVSEAAWEERRQLWDRLIPQGIPAQAGVTVDLVNERTPLEMPDEDEVRDAWPTLDARIRRVRLDALFAEIEQLVRAAGEPRSARPWRQLLALASPDSAWVVWAEAWLRDHLDTQVTPADLVATQR